MGAGLRMIHLNGTLSWRTNRHLRNVCPYIIINTIELSIETNATLVHIYCLVYDESTLKISPVS